MEVSDADVQHEVVAAVVVGESFASCYCYSLTCRSCCSSDEHCSVWTDFGVVAADAGSRLASPAAKSWCWSPKS